MNFNNGNLSDKELVRGCLKGDPRTQKALFEQYKVALYTLAFRLLNNKELANDALQDAFIEIFCSLKNYQFNAKLYTWMRTIVVRTAIAKLKQEKRIPIITDEIPEQGDAKNYDFTAEHLAYAILQLPEGTRTVFVLVEVEGYKHHEIAEQLNISVGTSKSQLSYAKKLLRQKLTAK